MATKKKGKRVIQVDFTGVEAGTGGRLLPERQYNFEVEDVSEEEGESSGEPYLKMTLAVTEGDYEGTKAWDNMSLQPQALWKLRGFLEAAGCPTEDGKMNIDPDDLIGLVVEADVVHEEYKGKKKHRIAGYTLPKVDDGGDGKVAVAGGGKKKATAADDDDATFKVKQKVKFKDGKKFLKGIITEVKGDQISVKVGEDEYEMDASDVTTDE